MVVIDELRKEIYGHRFQRAYKHDNQQIPDELRNLRELTGN